MGETLKPPALLRPIVFFLWRLAPVCPQLSGSATGCVEHRPARKSKSLNALQIGEETCGLGVVTTWELALVAGHRVKPRITVRGAKVFELPYTGRFSRWDSAQVLGVLQQAP